MPKKVRVSRNGLTTCPSCLSHIRVATEFSETECPFCQANLVVEVTKSSIFGAGMQKALSASKSGLLVASLLGTTTVIGCTEPPTDDPDMTIEQDMAPEPDPVQDYGVEPYYDMGEPLPTPDYGVEPVEDMGTD